MSLRVLQLLGKLQLQRQADAVIMRRETHICMWQTCILNNTNTIRAQELTRDVTRLVSNFQHTTIADQHGAER